MTFRKRSILVVSVAADVDRGGGGKMIAECFAPRWAAVSRRAGCDVSHHVFRVPSDAGEEPG